MGRWQDDWRRYEPTDDAPWSVRRVVHLHRRAGFAATWSEIQRDATGDPHDAITRLLAARHALPAVYPWREYAEAGGLMSYGPSLMDAYRQIGRYAARVLKGAKPGELPVQLPRAFEFIINAKTAKTLGLTVSRMMHVRADKVID